MAPACPKPSLARTQVGSLETRGSARPASICAKSRVSLLSSATPAGPAKSGATASTTTWWPRSLKARRRPAWQMERHPGLARGALRPSEHLVGGRHHDQSLAHGRGHALDRSRAYVVHREDARPARLQHMGLAPDPRREVGAVRPGREATCTKPDASSATPQPPSQPVFGTAPSIKNTLLIARSSSASVRRLRQRTRFRCRSPSSAVISVSACRVIRSDC
jgi:hypothetical protein